MPNNGWRQRRKRERKTKRRRGRMMLKKRKKIRRVALLCKIFVFHHRSSNAASINIQEVETCQNRNYLNFGPVQLLQHSFWCKKIQKIVQIPSKLQLTSCSRFWSPPTAAAAIIGEVQICQEDKWSPQHLQWYWSRWCIFVNNLFSLLPL